MKMSFYEQLGIVIPGSVLMFGLTWYYPALQLVTAKDGLSVGDLGLFVLIAYAAGHLVAAIANALETLFWGSLGGIVRVERESDPANQIVFELTMDTFLPFTEFEGLEPSGPPRLDGRSARNSETIASVQKILSGQQL